ncbi:MAG: cation:proton antiporter [Deltaproteobacteria bacterium]|nr:cation:proton antiporter [Deltaproteobacteria bacterium]
MHLSAADTAHVFLSLGLIVVFAHGFGTLFVRLHQPRVVGEILGGLLLGPTVLGALAPDIHAALFIGGRATPWVLGIASHLGLLLLMFSSGAEIRTSFDRSERRVVIAVSAAGTLLPFAAGIAFVQFIDTVSLLGAAADPTAFALILGAAIAVTSIPVISRIMLDLGLIETPFARIVLAAAVLEDILLYFVVAIALGIVGTSHDQLFGLPAILKDFRPDLWAVIYHVAATIGFFAVTLVAGTALVRRTALFRRKEIPKATDIAFQFVFLLSVVAIAMLLGVAPMFGAFVAGIVAGRAGDQSAQARESLKSFSFALFIPIYFASVGLRLNLIHGFDPLFFVAFLGYACVAKAASVFGSARLAGESTRGARNLAVALNARGGPGIVLATIAYEAKIISDSFFVVLVLLSIVTSMLAGAWLGWIVRRKEPLR